MKQNWSLLLLILPAALFTISCNEGGKATMDIPAAVTLAPNTTAAGQPVADNMTTAGAQSRAGVTHRFFCGLKDSNGNLFFVDVHTHAVVTNSANGFRMLRCSGKQPIASPAQTVTYQGFTCDIYGVTTTDSVNIIRKNGVSTLTCKVKN